ncbi:MAG: primosomal protein N' [Planctomycetes bacterium]|nr:primosomal protein N' [Planctomycetota bacterium]
MSKRKLFDFDDDFDKKHDKKREKPEKKLSSVKEHGKWFTGEFKIARMALPIPVHSYYDYVIPRPIEDIIKVGMRLRVPFRSRNFIGVCVEIIDETLEKGSRQLKEVIEVIDNEPIITQEILHLCSWISDYYCSPIGETINAAVPGGVAKKHKSAKKIIVRPNIPEGEEQKTIETMENNGRTRKQAKILKMLYNFHRDITPNDLIQKLGISMSPIQTLRRNGLIRFDKIDIDTPYVGNYKDSLKKDIVLTAQQEQAIATIRKWLKKGKFSAFLLQGVTSSGKTEVYIHAISEVLNNSGSSIFLVPEIALTPQTIARVRDRFGKTVAVWHSAMGAKERRSQWKSILSGESKVVIGVRSAVFAPVKKLKLIIVDEEHETTYKQQNNPRYNARDVAVQRAFMNNACVVLGSATPSIESRANAENNKYRFLKLDNRVGEGKLPKLVLVDMRIECIKQKRYAVLSEYLEDELNQRVSAGEQALLFINRRGAHTYLHCKECGYVFECSSCKVAMTYHRDIQKLVCHYCYDAEILPETCPKCGKESIVRGGIGIQEVEAEVIRKFPEYRVARMDSDTMTNRDAYEQTLGAFREGKIDVLIGTQMIAKGLDFPNITLVGVISADQMMSLPDFRASERTFQIISQVAGRAGRGKKEGLVIIQSFKPDESTFQLAMQHRFDTFFRKEINDRRATFYPPYCRILLLITESKNEAQGFDFMTDLRSKIEGFDMPSKISMLGPTPSLLSKIRDKFRHQILIKLPDSKNVRRLTTKLKEVKVPRNIKLIIDVDPFNFL